MLPSLLAVALSLAPVQGGYTTEEFPEHGLTLPRPRDFVLAPLPVEERWRVVYMVEKQSVSERAGRAKPPVCFVVRIDGDPEGALPAAEGEAPITDFDGYLRAFYQSFARSAPRSERERDGYAGSEHDLVPDGDASGAAWCFVYERADPTPRTFALVGYCGKTDLEALAPIWREMAGKMRFGEPVPPDPTALARLYENKPLAHADLRIELRRRLVRGWEAEDSEHHIVLAHGPRKPFLKRVLADLEGFRRAFDATFGPGADAPLGVVRLCDSRDEYLVYGGDPNNTSRWNADIGELVLFDPVQEGDRTAEDGALASLRGAMFLQYAEPRFLALAHPWFTMGHYDYYTGAQLSGKSLKVRPSRTLAYVQSRIEKDDLPPVAELMGMPRKQFDAANAFAPSGSLVHFLRESKEARANERWSGLLDRYLSTLVATYAERSSDGDEKAARAAAQAAALAAALEGVDAAELGDAWAKATLRLKAD